MAYCVVQTTCTSQGEAQKLAQQLVEAKLVACAQLMPIESIYWWHGEVVDDKQVLLQLKTRPEKFPEIETFLRANHSDTVPEVVMLPIEGGLTDYLNWIDESVGERS